MAGKARGSLFRTLARLLGRDEAHRLLFFVHIPKTAGTSLVSAIEAHFAPDRICPRSRTEALARLDPAALRRQYDFIPAHVGMNVAGPIGTELITVLREPVARILSLYNYWRSMPPAAATVYENGRVDPAVSLAQSLSFRDFVFCDHPRILHDINNGQAFQLAASNNAAGRRDLAGLSEAEVLARAKKNLARMAAVGVTENLPAFQAQMQDRLGLTLEIPLRNKTQKTFVAPEALDPEVTARLQELNRIDLALYDFVRATWGR